MLRKYPTIFYTVQFTNVTTWPTFNKGNGEKQCVCSLVLWRWGMWNTAAWSTVYQVGLAMKIKHTKGPWTINSQKTGKLLCVANNSILDDEGRCEDFFRLKKTHGSWRGTHYAAREDQLTSGTSAHARYFQPITHHQTALQSPNYFSDWRVGGEGFHHQASQCSFYYVTVSQLTAAKCSVAIFFFFSFLFASPQPQLVKSEKETAHCNTPFPVRKLSCSQNKDAIFLRFQKPVENLFFKPAFLNFWCKDTSCKTAK